VSCYLGRWHPSGRCAGGGGEGKRSSPVPKNVPLGDPVILGFLA
jgi:hypothetical protein